MKCFAISKIVGDGLTPATARRAKIFDYLNRATESHVSLFTQFSDGSAALPWALVAVNAEPQTLNNADADPDIVILPRIAMDASISTVLTNLQLIALRNRLQRRGIDTSGITGEATLRQLVRRFGRQHSLGFDENKLAI